MLSERSQSQNVTCVMIPFMWNIQNRDRKQISGCQGLKGGEKREGLLDIYEVFSGGDENVLNVYRGNVCTTLWIY